MPQFNYGEYIFQQLLTTEFVQHKLVCILVALTANFVQLHIVAILCFITSFNPYADFFIQIVISIIIALCNNYIYNFTERYTREFTSITTYLINNYSIDNYYRWKRLIMLSACAYSCLLLLLVHLTNWILFVYIIQYACCFLIVEQFEQERIQQWIKNYRDRPTSVYHIDPETDFLIESYMSPKKNMLQNKLVISKNMSGSITTEKRHSRGPATWRGLVELVNSVRKRK